MNVVTSIDNYDNNYVFFTDPIQNTVITDSDFVRIIYSNNDIVLNGIYLYISFSHIIMEQYYNKYKCVFCKKINSTTINQLETLEKNILSKYITTKTPEYSIHNQIMNGYIKIFTSSPEKYKSDNNIQLVLKISGIWENDNTYGVTFKFIPIE